MENDLNTRITSQLSLAAILPLLPADIASVQCVPVAATPHRCSGCGGVVLWAFRCCTYPLPQHTCCSSEEVGANAKLLPLPSEHLLVLYLAHV
jgi:hypothetical protein